MKPGQKDDYEFYSKAGDTVNYWWMKAFSIWYNMEIKGFDENFPGTGPTILVFFHGAIPLDIYYFLHNKRLKYGCFGVTDKFMFKFPLYKYYAKTYNIIDGEWEDCVKRLNDRQTMVVAPGGTYEGQCGDHNYKVMWRRRLGFAKLAIKTEATILPCFCSNLQEAYRPIGIFKSFWESLYLKTRLPLVPMFGGFPVKLTLHVGEPIQADLSMDPEVLKNKVIGKLEEMIRKNQRIPGSIMVGMLDRFTSMF